MAESTAQAMVLERPDVTTNATATATDRPVLSLRELPRRTPKPGEVVIAVEAAALNRRDLWITLGKYSGIRFPAILGSDGAGVVRAVGAGVSESLVGTEVVVNPSLAWGPNQALSADSFRVLGMPDDGTFAEELCIAATQVRKKPAHLSFVEAAALPLAGITAYRALCYRGRLRAAETVLIPGIGSGVSTMALLFARHLGARTIVTSGSEEKLQRARELGADFAISYRQPDWDKQIARWSDGGPDLIVDGVGGETWQKCVGIARAGARVVSYGATSGVATLDLRRLFWRHLDVMGSTMGSERDFDEMLAIVSAGKLRPVVDTVLPLSDAMAALSRMEQNQHMGKIVLKIRNAKENS